MPISDWRLPERFDHQGHAIAWGAIGAGPPAVVMHGSPFSSLVWRRIAQVAQMDDRYSQEVERRYGEIRCPVRILWGAEDAFIPLKDEEELARRIPGAPLTVIPDAGHLVQEDAPEAIVAAVLEFWMGRDGGR